MMDQSISSVPHQPAGRSRQDPQPPPPQHQPGQKRDRMAAGLTGGSGQPDRFRTSGHGHPESDSFNETGNNHPFPGVHRKPVRERTHTKRKRKCKRIALDPEMQGSGNGKQPSYPIGGGAQ